MSEYAFTFEEVKKISGNMHFAIGVILSSGLSEIVKNEVISRLKEAKEIIYDKL